MDFLKAFHIEFIRPWMLLLLLLVPWIIYQARGVRILSTFRKRLAIGLRIFLIVLLVLALAEPQWRKSGEGLTVFFLLDNSESIPAEQREYGLEFINHQIKTGKQDEDRCGLIVFGKDAVIESEARQYMSVAQLSSIVDARGTDIAGAIRLAMAAFPPDAAKRIVLLSDGNQTSGDAELEAKRAAAKDVEISVAPLRYVYDQEIVLREVVMPSHVRTDEPFDVKVLVDSLYEGDATLRLYGDGQLVTEQPVTLEKGLNAFVVTQETDAGGFHSYTAVVEAADDARPDNNRGSGFVVIRGLPRVLILDGADGANSQYLAAALNAEGMSVEVRGPSGAPGSLAEFEAYDAIVLADFAASYLSHDQMLMIQSAVRDFGTGLLMIGGEDSFGSGGYLNTPIEQALPVSMDIKQRKVIPSGALAMIMHTCEIAQGNYWAQQISLAALDVLSPQDYVGFLRYSNTQGESWLFPLGPAGNKKDQKKLLSTLSWQDIGDMPSFDYSLRLAYQGLTDPGIPCNLKHIVIISDGDPQPPSQALASKIKSAGITISTVTIAPHTPNSVAVMKNLAQWGGGNAYYVQDNQELPRIFAKEATTVKRGLIIEEPFTPAITRMHEALLGFPQGFPDLLGYVIVTPKPNADLCMVTHQEDPLFSTWRHGIGKAAAWTSDAAPRWGQNWISWDGYVQFWSQVVRWLLPESEDQNIQVTTSIEGDRARIVVDAVNDDGQFLNGLNFAGSTRVDPSIGNQGIEFRHTAPGRYEATFPVSDPGSHMMSLRYKGEDASGEIIEGQVTSGLAVPFSPEQASTTSNERILELVAEAGGGKVISHEDDAFTHDLAFSREITPLWPLLLAVGLILFFLDIAQRRLVIDTRQMREAWARLKARIPLPAFLKPAAVGPATEEIGSLMQAKTRALKGAPRPAAEQYQRERGQGEAVGEEHPGETREDLLTRLDRLASEGVEDQAVKPAQREHPASKPDDTGQAVPEPLDRSPSGKYTGSLLEAKRRAQEKFKQKD